MAPVSFKNLMLFSPLEQFDSVTWIGVESIFETALSYGLRPFVTEFPIITLLTANAPVHFSVAFLLAVSTFIVLAFRTFGNVSFTYLVAAMHLFFGFVVSLWFTDSFVAVETLNGIRIADLPSISFYIGWDETFVTFLLGFFLLNGSEAEEDTDFLLEEEGGSFVEDVVAPLFLTNLGKDVEGNGSLFLQVCGIFAFVFTNNLMGMIPYSDTATSSLMLTFWVSLSVFASLITLMLRKQGINHLFSLFMPTGAPVGLIFLIIPLEFISYVFRLVSLPVRLFANMMAGHILLKVIVGFSWSMILLGDGFLIANLFPVAVLFILTFLEIGVAIIQAYIFTILTCIYFKDVFVGH